MKKATSIHKHVPIKAKNIMPKKESKMNSQEGIAIKKSAVATKQNEVSSALLVVMNKTKQFTAEIVITNDEQFEQARARYKMLREMSAEVDRKFAAIVDPLKTSISEIKTLFKPATALLADTCERLETSLSKYANDREIERQNALARIESDKRLKNVETIQSKREDVGDRLGGTMRLKRLKIEDATLIPREYLVPDEKKILTALLEGKKVKGCKVVEELTIVNR